MKSPALDVEGVLEGSVSRVGDRVHMTIQLIDAPSDAHLWAESYDRDANDLVSLPRDAAQTIAKRLDSAVPLAAQARFVSPEAHDAYYHGQYLWLTGLNDKAGEYFKKATQLQPDYALGWSGLSDYYGLDAIEGNRSPAGTLPQAEAAARKAVELDDSLPEAHAALCAALFAAHWTSQAPISNVFAPFNSIPGTPRAIIFTPRFCPCSTGIPKPSQ